MYFFFFKFHSKYFLGMVLYDIKYSQKSINTHTHTGFSHGFSMFYGDFDFIQDKLFSISPTHQRKL